MHTYPVITRISAGAFNGSNQADHEPVGAYHSTRLVKPRVVDGAARQPFAVQVSGHAMTNPASPWDFPHGTLALCDPGCMPDLNDFVAVVDLTDETLALRQLVNRARLPERDLWLVALNPDPAYAAIKLDDGMHAVAGVVLEAYLPKYARK
ncbi:S24 family peptidase [Comamonadaceae bacterium OH2545_COT-014]|nr:S24 family peptidase [Comamonadaceae bacterium OH2545_COT-014]